MPPEPRQEPDGGLWGVQEGVDPPRKRLLGADTAQKPNLAPSQETRERGGSAGELCVTPKVRMPLLIFGGRKRDRDAAERPQNNRNSPRFRSPSPSLPALPMGLRGCYPVTRSRWGLSPPASPRDPAPAV